MDRGGGEIVAQRPLRFSTAREVRESLTKVANETRAGTLSPQKANAIICAANVILSSIKTEEQERNFAKLDLHPVIVIDV